MMDMNESQRDDASIEISVKSCKHRSHLFQTCYSQSPVAASHCQVKTEITDELGPKLPCLISLSQLFNKISKCFISVAVFH